MRFFVAWKEFALELPARTAHQYEAALPALVDWRADAESSVGKHNCRVSSTHRIKTFAITHMHEGYVEAAASATEA